MSGKKRGGGLVVGVLVMAGLAIVLAACLQPRPVTGRSDLFLSSDAVRVERGTAWLAFLPTGLSKRSALVFYPGAKVSPEAYAYLGHACAQAGYAVFVPNFPLGLAVTRPGVAAAAAAAYPAAERWVIGGHSLGGAMACAYATGREVAGLFLLAAYAGRGTDLSGAVIDTVSVSASEDLIADPEEIARSAARLPAGTRFVEIGGGNHAQFGEYGPQRGDGVAAIAGEAQRAAVVEEALALLDRIERGF